jgi:hypothetical protein
VLKATDEDVVRATVLLLSLDKLDEEKLDEDTDDVEMLDELGLSDVLSPIVLELSELSDELLEFTLLRLDVLDDEVLRSSSGFTRT